MSSKLSTQELNRRKFLNCISAVGAAMAVPGIVKAQSTRQLKQVKKTALLSLNTRVALTSEEQKIADDIIQKAKHQFATAVANPDKDYLQSFAKIGKKFTTTTFKPVSAKAQKKALAMLTAPENEQSKDFGRFRTATPSSYQQKTLSPEFQASSTLSKIDQSTLVSTRITRTANTGVTVAKPKPRLKNLKKLKAARFKEITLYIREIESIRETNEVGADEILMSTSGYLPNGARVKGAEHILSTDFDSGERINYVDPSSRYFEKTPWPHGKRMSIMSLDSIAELSWPYSYSWVSVMGEEDAGGFGDLVQDLWDSVDEEVKKYFAAAGASIGAAIGSIWPGIGTAIGAVIGAILGALADWLVELFDNPDDYIDKMTLELNLTSNTKAYFQDVWGGSSSPNFDIIFKGDGGKFRGNFGFNVS